MTNKYRYTVTATKVDGGTYTAGYDSRKDALSAATLVAFGFGGYEGMMAAGRCFVRLKTERALARISYEPSSHEWFVSIAKHKA